MVRRTCEKLILKDVIRVGVESFSDEYGLYWRWHHYGCWLTQCATLPDIELKNKIIDMQGFDRLKKMYQNAMLKLWPACEEEEFGLCRPSAPPKGAKRDVKSKVAKSGGGAGAGSTSVASKDAKRVNKSKADKANSAVGGTSASAAVANATQDEGSSTAAMAVVQGSEVTDIRGGTEAGSTVDVNESQPC